MRRNLVLALVLLVTVLGIVIGREFYPTKKATFALASLPTSTPIRAGMEISSPAFENNHAIPKIYTCDGKNINPSLLFSNIPQRAKNLALIVDDPDAPAGTWVHWIVFNIPTTTKEIAENSVPAGSTLGITSFGKPGYGGPCPPSGTHRYFFKLYALDTIIDASRKTTKAILEAEIQGHIIDQAETIGLYQRT